MTVKMYKEFPVRYEGSGKKRVWFGRHIGLILGYGSDGGNFTRNFSTTWKKLFQEGRHWVTLPVGHPERGGQKALWLTDQGLKLALYQVHHERIADDAKGALAVTTLMDWLIKHTPLKLSGPRAKLEPAMPIFSETLGAAMEVRYTRKGILSFTFLDTNDVAYSIPTSELDKGWEKKLLQAMGARKK